MVQETKPSRSKLGIAITSVLLGGTLVAGSLVGQNTNAKSLTPDAEAALQQAGVTGVTVTMKGREAYLSGPGVSQDQLDKAKAAVEGVYGVRWARVEGGATGAPTTPTETPTSTSPTLPAVTPQVDITSGAGGTVLTGTVATQAEANALVAAAEKAYGAPVVNHLVVDPKCEDQPWVGQLADAMDKFPPITGAAVLKAGPSGIEIGGEVASQADVDVIKAATAGISVPTNVNLSVSPPKGGGLTDAEIAQINAAVVNFDFGSYTLDAKAKAKLDAIVPLLAKSTAGVMVKGYVSLPNKPETLVANSERRAQAVADYLVSKGIDRNRFKVMGMGADDPVASNDTPAGQYLNQRVTLTVA